MTQTAQRPVTLADPVATFKFALAAAEMAANTRCEEVVLLDLRGRSPATEFFVIATGTSPRQMRTAVDEIAELGKQMGFRPWQTSGYDSAKWILLDCVNVVAHVFDGDSRDFYDLELLWGDCPRIDWRKELGLAPAPEFEGRARRTSARFAQAAGGDEMDAEEEDARLEGRNVDDEEGDADVDEDAESDSPIVMELPDESTGSNSVEFVEIDPPASRRQRGRAVYPTPIGDVDDEEGEEKVRSLGGADESLDEDDQERAAEARADEDPEAVSSEDLPRDRIKFRPMGGVSANLSDTNIVEEEEEAQRGERDFDDREQDHRDERTGAYGTAAPAGRGKAARKGAKKPVKKAAVKKPVKKAAVKKTLKKGAPKKKAKAPAKKGAAKKKPQAKKASVKKKAPGKKKKR